MPLQTLSDKWLKKRGFKLVDSNPPIISFVWNADTWTLEYRGYVYIPEREVRRFELYLRSQTVWGRKHFVEITREQDGQFNTQSDLLEWVFDTGYVDQGFATYEEIFGEDDSIITSVEIEGFGDWG